jgi:hypothetical protein
MSYIYGERSMTEVTDAYGLRGRTMVDRDGDKIDDVYEDRHSGRPEWALFDTGLFGSKKAFVPLDEAQSGGDDVRVPLELAEGHAPGLAALEIDGDARS